MVSQGKGDGLFAFAPHRPVGCAETTRIENDNLHRQVEVSWTQTADGKGYERPDFDDSGTMEFTAKNRGFKKQTWSFEVDSFGDGVGTWQQDGISCDLKFSEHSCKQTACSDGSANRACTLPVDWPRF